MRSPTMWYVRPAKPQILISKSDQSLCLSLEYSMTDKLLTEHHLEFLRLKGVCTGSSESTHVKMPHCWKSHVAAQMRVQGSHRLEMYLNKQDCLEKSLKIKFALKST